MFAHPRKFLAFALGADAVASGATGALMLFGAGPLAGLLGLPEPLLRAAGLALLPFAAFVGWLATRERPSRPLVWAVVVVNLLWVVDSAALLLSGWVAPTALGYAFVIAQAVAVAVLAELQVIAQRRLAAPAAA